MRKRAVKKDEKNRRSAIKPDSSAAHADASQNGSVQDGNSISPVPARTGGPSTASLNEKIKELIRLAKEQGHLTFDDLNEILGDGIATPEELDLVHTKLRNLDIEVLDASEGEESKPSEDDEEEPQRYDLLDDP